MNLRHTFNVGAAFFAVSMVCSGAFAQTSSAMVEFDQIGQALDLKNMSAKDKAALKQLNIDGDGYFGGIGSGVRVVKVVGGSGLYVMHQSCDAAANGSSESCELMTVGSLTTGKEMGIPGGRFLSSFREANGTSGDSRYLKNEKGELQSIVYAATYIKKIKGQKSCDSRGAVIDFDAKNMKLAVRTSKKPLGNSCQAPDQLFSKVLSD